MISPRPFQAHQFALLHLLGLLSISKPQDPLEANGDPHDTEDVAGLLILPQEVIINAYCYLTEQIHEVARPPPTLESLVKDVYYLASYLIAPPPTPPAEVCKESPANARSTRRASTRSPTKRASVSPSASTRSTRRSASRGIAATVSPETASVNPPPQLEHHPLAPTNIRENEELPNPTFSIDGEAADRSKAAFPLAHKLYTNVLSDIARMKEERSEALFACLGEFRILLGDLDNPNNVAFLDRTSPLGLWLRRANLNLHTMPFVASEQLIEDLLVWAGLNDSRRRDLDEQLFFSVTEAASPDSNTLKIRTQIFEEYQEAMRREDYSQSLELMQRFFDYETFPLAGGSSANRGMRQHALLNLAHFHLVHEEFPSARIAANEGLKIARQTSDHVTLNALTSIFKKVSFDDSHEKMEYRDSTYGDALTGEAGKEDFGGYVPPMDYLWDVRFGISTRVPLPALMFDILRAKATHYFAANQKTNLSSKERRKEKKLAAQQGKDALNTGADVQQKRLRWNRLDAIGWLATSADLWDRMGSHDLAQTYHLMSRITKRGDIDPFSGARIATRCKQAEYLARQGQFINASTTLLAEVLHLDRSKMTVRDLQLWQRTVYTVLCLEAERSENDFLCSEVDRICPPAVPGRDFPQRASSSNGKSALGFPTIDVDIKTESGLIGEIEGLIHRAEKFLAISEHAAATPLAVQAVALSSLSDGQGFLCLYWRAILILVRVQVAWRTCDRALRILNEVWADVLGSLDNELIAYASEVRADTLVALVEEVINERQTAGDEGQQALYEAAALLLQAADISGKLGSPSRRIENLSKCAKIYHRLEDIPSRNQIASLCREASVQWQATKKQIHEDQIRRFSQIQQICAYASAIVASA